MVSLDVRAHSLAEQSHLNLWGTCIRIVAAKIVKYLYFRFFG